MVQKVTPKPTPPNDDYIHQYGDDPNQYGAETPGGPGSFQSYMNDGMTQGGNEGASQSPMNMMSNPQSSTFGAPQAPDAPPLGGPAPENFGAPSVGQAPSSSFGAPNDTPNSQAIGAQGNTKANNQNNSLQSAGTNPTPPPAKKKGTHTYKGVEKTEISNMVQNAITQMKVKDPDPDVWSE